jgi:hypothetical protein
LWRLLLFIERPLVPGVPPSYDAHRLRYGAGHDCEDRIARNVGNARNATFLVKISDGTHGVRA